MKDFLKLFSPHLLARCLLPVASVFFPEDGNWLLRSIGFILVALICKALLLPPSPPKKGGFRIKFLVYINKIQQDATVCRYLFTAKSLYMFGASVAPIIRST